MRAVVRSRPVELMQVPELEEAPEPVSIGVFRVKNTFIEGPFVPSSPSSAEFFQQRLVQSCPSARVGCLKAAFEDFASVSTQTPEVTPRLSSQAPAAESPGAAAADSCFWGSTPQPEDAVPCLAWPPIPQHPGLWEIIQEPSEDEMPIATAAELNTLSAGSEGHALGRCKPCAFFHTKGCDRGADCEFCHLCPPDERKRRRKEKDERRRTAREARQHRVTGPGRMSGVGRHRDVQDEWWTKDL